MYAQTFLWSLFLNLKKNTSRLWEYFLQHIKFFSCANVYGDKVWSEMLRNEISGYAKKFCTKGSAHVVKRQEPFNFWLNIKMCSFGVRFNYSSPFKNTNTREPLNYFFFKSLNWFKGTRLLASTQILLPILMSTKTFLWLRLQAAYVELDSFE